MQYTVTPGKTVVTLFAALPITVFLLDRLTLINNYVIRIASMALLLIAYSLALLFLFTRKKKEKAEKGSRRSAVKENGPIGVLIPVDDESDLGELLEVSDAVPTAEALHVDEDVEDRKLVNGFVPDASAEILEELQAAEEPVEELESIDD